MNINTILFDLDGTVTDSLPLIKRTYAKVFKEMDIPWGKDDVMNLIGLPLKDIGRQMAGVGKEDDFFDKYQKYYRLEHDQYMSLYSGTLQIIETLKNKGFTLGVVTSKSLYGTNKTLDFLDIDKYFSVIVTADDPIKHKPNPDPVLLALDKLDKKPKNAIYVGDSPFDIEAGNRAGVTTIAVTWGMATEEKLKEYDPTVVVHTREELLDYILKNTD